MNEVISLSPCWSKTRDAPMTEEFCTISCKRKHDEWKKPTWFGPWITSDPDNCIYIIPNRKLNYNKYLG